MGAHAVEITHQRNITCINFKPGDTYIVGADRSGNIRQWNSEDGAEIGLPAVKMNGSIYAATVSQDGRWIVSGGAGNMVVVWNAVTHYKVTEITDHTTDVYALDISSDSTRFASGSGDKTVRIFDITSGRRLIPPLQHNASMTAVKFSPDGSRIVTATYSHPFVGIYDTHSGQKLYEIPIVITASPITPLVWSNNGQQLFVSSQGKITYLDTSTWSRSDWSIHDHTSLNVAIVTNSKLIACSAGSSISFWDFTSHEQIGSLINHSTAVNCIAISHDGRYLACGRDTGITIHNLEEFLPQCYTHAICRLPLMQVSEAVLKSWVLGNPTTTNAILSDEILQHSTSSHYTYAARALMRVHSGEWGTAMEDAHMSLQIKNSPIGQIARSVALVGVGEQEVALEDLDFMFRDCDPRDNVFLLVVKSVFVFICNKRKQAISRLRGLIDAADEKMKGHYLQVLGKMYLKQGDYEDAVQTFQLATNLKTLQPQTSSSVSGETGPLATISLIFNWKFENLEFIAWERLCETLYTSGSIRKVGETLVKMVSPLAEDEKEAAYCHILEEIVTRSGEVTLLAWTGISSTCNSCLPSSPAIYSEAPCIRPTLKGDTLEKRTAELRAIIPLADAMFIFGRMTRLQPVRFVHFRLHLPCIVFRTKRLRKEQECVYRADIAGLGDVEFTTADSLPLNEPRRLVVVNPWIHHIREACGGITWDDSSESDMESSMDMRSYEDTDTKLVHPLIEEVSTVSSEADMYTQALQLIAHLEQPFSALLLLKQPDGAYKRVAADRDISVHWVGDSIPRDVRMEVLEVL